MRVLFWSERFWPSIGGSEVFGTQLIRALEQRGHEFLVVTRQVFPEHPKEDRFDGIPIIRVPFQLTLKEHKTVDKIMSARKQIGELKRTFAPNLIHIHGIGPTSLLFHLDTASVSSTPLLITLISELNELEEYGIGYESLRRILSLATWVTSKAESIQNEMRGVVPAIVRRSSVIRNGIDIPDLLPTPLPLEPPRLLCLGRLAWQKGFDLALAAFASIRGRFPKVRLVLAGDGPERGRLKKLVDELQLSDSVDLLGWVPPREIPTLINDATMVLMPSRWEGLPSVALQASMMQRPLVVTSVGGLSEIVLHGKTGWLVETEDSKGLAHGIAYLLEHPGIAALWGEAARRRMLEVFRWDTCIDQYDALYRHLAG